MLALGVALNVAKRVLLIDELSQGLAPGVLPPLADAVMRVNQVGYSVLIVEQNARLAVQLTDKIHVMEDGRFVSSGGITEVVSRLKSEIADAKATDLSAQQQRVAES
jgi:branched-chain amino acid transport system ATP-binding protein